MCWPMIFGEKTAKINNADQSHRRAFLINLSIEINICPKYRITKYFCENYFIKWNLQSRKLPAGANLAN
jgi:hypothetical protein